MKKTLLFSNVVGNISIKNNTELKFNKYMEEYLFKNVKGHNKLLFINAPGLGGESNYLKNVIKCFQNLQINFYDIFNLELDSNKDKLEEFIKDEEKVVYFLMGGNPLTQMEIINKFNLKNRIKEHDGLVIGFCAGAINLSKYSIITTDDDFKKSLSYQGIGRVDISVEPHFNLEDSEFTKNRLKEIDGFCKTLKTEIYAIPDKSVIDVLGDSIGFYGEIYKYF